MFPSCQLYPWTKTCEDRVMVRMMSLQTGCINKKSTLLKKWKSKAVEVDLLKWNVRAEERHHWNCENPRPFKLMWRPKTFVSLKEFHLCSSSVVGFSLCSWETDWHCFNLRYGHQIHTHKLQHWLMVCLRMLDKVFQSCWVLWLKYYMRGTKWSCVYRVT